MVLVVGGNCGAGITKDELVGCDKNGTSYFMDFKVEKSVTWKRPLVQSFKSEPIANDSGNNENV